jgi:transcriptional regulator with XRE-family HTH domain
MADFSKNVKRLRTQRDMSQEQLAEKLGVARQTVSSWERGISYPDLPMLEKLAQVLDTDLNGLLYPQVRSGRRQPEEPLRFRFVPLAMLLYVVLLVLGAPLMQVLGIPMGNGDTTIIWAVVLLVGFVAFCTYVISKQIAGDEF